MTALLDRLAKWIGDGDWQQVHNWSDDHLARKRRRKVKAAPRIQRERVSKAQRAENWQTIRTAVLARADGRCELCKSPDLCLDAHHVLGGPERRKWESVTTVLGLCRSCHRMAHEGDSVTLNRVLGLVTRLDAPYYVQAALNRRIAKVTK